MKKTLLAAALLLFISVPSFAQEEEAAPAGDTPAAETAPKAEAKAGAEGDKAKAGKEKGKQEKPVAELPIQTTPPPLSGRAMNELGFFVSTLGFPTFNVWNLNFSYNIFEWLRATAGFGNFSKDVQTDVGPTPATISTFGAAAWATIPGWNFSPTVGLGYSSQSVGIEGTAADAADVFLGLSSIDTSYVTLNVGFDWQTNAGFNLGLGMALFLSADEVVTTTMEEELGFSAGLPYVYMGWSFDIF